MNKILRYSLMLLVAMVSTVSYAQTTVTFTAGTDKGTLTGAGTAADKVSKDGITIETTTGNSAFAAEQYRFAKSSTTTFSSTVGKITKVVFTCTANGTAKYGPGCFTQASGETGSYTYKDKEGTWTGEAESFTLTASSNQVRATKIEVTYQTASGDVKKAAELKWSESSVSLKEGGDFTAPTFSKATTANVTFQSDNEAVATVNSDGVISLGTEVGFANITATSEENDMYLAGTATCAIEVYNVNVYKKVTSIESGKKYVIAAQRDGATFYAYPLSPSADKPTPYGYLQSGKVDGAPDKLEINKRYDDSFVFTAEGNGYSIKDSKNGLYYVQSGIYNSFNTSTTPSEWTIDAQSDGTFKITMNGYYIQYGQGTFTTFGMWTEAQENAVMPCLYVYDDVATGIDGVKKPTVDNQDAPVYNLAGQRVSKDYKGVVIQNGKKRINK